MRNLNSTYLNQTVYIVAEGSKISLISTAPYVDEALIGRVAGLTKNTNENDTEPENESEDTETITSSVLKLTEARIYNNESYVWDASPNLSLIIPFNSIVIKNGVIGSVSLIKPGDEVRIIRHSQSKEGIIVLCQ